MRWALIILLVFVAALLLVARLYTAKGEKGQETSHQPSEDPGASDETDADGE
jgi:hypothetical protein